LRSFVIRSCIFREEERGRERGDGWRGLKVRLTQPEEFRMYLTSPWEKGVLSIYCFFFKRVLDG